MRETTVNKSMGTRDRILRAAGELMAKGGREAMTTRAVAAAAGVQAPTIYRQFGDVRGLLDAVVSHGFSQYLRDKSSREHAEDPVEELRNGWDLHVAFGLANPAVYALMSGYPRPEAETTAAVEATKMLRGLVQRVAEAGRLRVGVERGAQMLEAACRGVTLVLIGTKPGDRDPALSETTCEAILSAMTTDGIAETAPGKDDRERLVNRAVALRAILPEAGDELTDGERTVLSEWLDRIADLSPADPTHE